MLKKNLLKQSISQLRGMVKSKKKKPITVTEMKKAIRNNFSKKDYKSL